MKYKLLTFFLTFVITVFALDFLSYLVLGKLDGKSLYGMSGGTIHYYLERKDPPDVLIMGSSRAHHNLIPDSLSVSSFNLSHNGMALGYHVVLAHILADRNMFPKKLLILNIETEELNPADKAVSNDVRFLKGYYDSNPMVRSEINETGRFEFLKFAFRSYQYNGNIPSIIKNFMQTRKHPNRKDDGFEGHPATARDSLNTMVSFHKYKAGTRRLDSVFDFNGSKAETFLSELAALCKAHGVRLVLFTAPMFHSEELPAMHAEHFNAFLEREDIPYYDFRKVDMPALADPHYWKDFTHLNIKGARIFSHQFKEILEQNKILP